MSGPPATEVGRAAALSAARRRLLVLGLAAVVVAADQATKTWALHHAPSDKPIHLIGTLQLAVTFNSGAAFGLGQGATPVLIGGAIVLVVLLLGLGRTASRTASLPAAVAMGLLLGGACGNLVDRLVRQNHGAVIDFVDLRWWPVFNVADACITIGALLLIVTGAGHRRSADATTSDPTPERHKGSAPAAPAAPAAGE
jgi:signal peptidase II